VDVDVWVPDEQPWSYVDYTLLHKTVSEVFARPGQLLETFVANIHAELKNQFPVAEKVRVAVRKKHPPMPGQVAYAQVCYEK
jgi:dihydroneopterin aldolase